MNTRPTDAIPTSRLGLRLVARSSITGGRCPSRPARPRPPHSPVLAPRGASRLRTPLLVSAATLFAFSGCGGSPSPPEHATSSSSTEPSASAAHTGTGEDKDEVTSIANVPEVDEQNEESLRKCEAAKSEIGTCATPRSTLSLTLVVHNNSGASMEYVPLHDDELLDTSNHKTQAVNNYLSGSEATQKCPALEAITLPPGGQYTFHVCFTVGKGAEPSRLIVGTGEEVPLK